MKPTRHLLAALAAAALLTGASGAGAQITLFQSTTGVDDPSLGRALKGGRASRPT